MYKWAEYRHNKLSIFKMEAPGFFRLYVRFVASHGREAGPRHIDAFI